MAELPPRTLPLELRRTHKETGMKKLLSLLFVSALFVCGVVSAQYPTAAQQNPTPPQQMLADKHMAGSNNCVMCHETTPAPGAVVTTEKCNSCHGSLEAVSAINRAKPDAQFPNPHVNHSIGLNCNECHMAHQASQNMCARCHNFQYQMP